VKIAAARVDLRASAPRDTEVQSASVLTAGAAALRELELLATSVEIRSASAATTANVPLVSVTVERRYSEGSFTPCCNVTFVLKMSVLQTVRADTVLFIM
jgi:hypothetical protein